MIEYLKALLFGIVEGITEWLPVSSTGHMILLDEFIHLTVSTDAAVNAEFYNLFEVVIQLGAILAVIVMYFGKLNPFARLKSADEKKATWSLWGKVVFALIPSMVLGVLLDDWLDAHLYTPTVVALALVVYGVVFLFLEKLRPKGALVEDTAQIPLRTALLIGLFQCLAMIPGTSRSGSTILGAMLLGLSRPAAAEFSFFLAIPTMAGASALRGLKFVKFTLENGVSFPTSAWLVLLVATAAAFFVSLAAIKFLTDFVKKHSFAPFGVYRIALGVLLLIYFAATKQAAVVPIA
ncbi:MAG: undecaprenyl-diphosphate phosphatase [Ruminococcaceae bacterium]|nr:undecaprenyl-diphosphate phosphatase [Oscillospiraceae bacterium]